MPKTPQEVTPKPHLLSANAQWQTDQAHKMLDRMHIPSDDGEDNYSIWGRINRAFENVAGLRVNINHVAPDEPVTYTRISPGVEELVSHQQPLLEVFIRSFPESNGKMNWTAMLKRVAPWNGLIGNCGGITLERGELWNRVAYAAERTKFLLGLRDTEPDIMDYGVDITHPKDWKGEVNGGRKPKPPTGPMHAEHRYAGYSGQPPANNATVEELAAWKEGVEAAAKDVDSGHKAPAQPSASTDTPVAVGEPKGPFPALPDTVMTTEEQADIAAAMGILTGKQYYGSANAVGNLMTRFGEMAKEVERLKPLSVESIMLEIVPGDGSGFEVYAKSVEDVNKKLGDLGERLENYELGITKASGFILCPNMSKLRKALADRKFRGETDLQDLVNMAANVISQDATSQVLDTKLESTWLDRLGVTEDVAINCTEHRRVMSLALEVLQKHRQIKGDWPVGELGRKASEDLQSVLAQDSECFSGQGACENSSSLKDSQEGPKVKRRAQFLLSDTIAGRSYVAQFFRGIGRHDFEDYIRTELAGDFACVLASELVASPTPLDGGLAWAVTMWENEVKNRPLVNVHRRTLDGVWRRVIRFFGGNPDELVGPSHDALLAAQEPQVHPINAAERMSPELRADVRDIFLANGFDIKEGHTDLKDYVYRAAEHLIDYARKTAPTGVDPEMGPLIDAANPGELAFYDYAVQQHCVAVLAILDGNDNGTGNANEPWGPVRDRLLNTFRDNEERLYLMRRALTNSGVMSQRELAQTMRDILHKTTDSPSDPETKPMPGRVELDGTAGEIMGAAYDFRDAHLSGSKNQIMSAHSILLATVREALKAKKE